MVTTTFDRAGERQASAATEIAIQELGFFSLTAMRTDAGKLKLINWRTGDPDVTGIAEVSGGPVSEIALTRNLNRTVTAVSDGTSGDLLLSSWSDGAGQGPIAPLQTINSGVGAASLIVVQPIPALSNANLVTAVKSADKLKLNTWHLEGGSGNFTPLGDSGGQAGNVKLIAASVQRNVVVTAARTACGTLELVAWHVSQDGTIDRRGMAEAGEVSEIAMAGMVTAVRTGSGKLKLISWRVSPDGQQIERLLDHTAGKATLIALSRSSTTRFVAAVKNDDGDLKLIAYDVDPNTGLITRTSDKNVANHGGEISEVALATPSQNNITTAVRDGGDRLKIITYQMTDT